MLIHKLFRSYFVIADRGTSQLFCCGVERMEGPRATVFLLDRSQIAAMPSSLRTPELVLFETAQAAGQWFKTFPKDGRFAMYDGRHDHRTHSLNVEDFDVFRIEPALTPIGSVIPSPA